MRVQEREGEMQREGGRDREKVKKWGEKGSLSVQRWENSSHTSWCDRWSLRASQKLTHSYTNPHILSHQQGGAWSAAQQQFQLECVLWKWWSQAGLIETAAQQSLTRIIISQHKVTDEGFIGMWSNSKSAFYHLPFNRDVAQTGSKVPTGHKTTGFSFSFSSLWLALQFRQSCCAYHKIVD